MKKEMVRILEISGICGMVSMIYELVWVRYLGLLLGTSVYAAGTVTGCYMIGMAAGDFLLGKGAEKGGQRLQRKLFLCLFLMLLLSPVIYQLLWYINANLASDSWPGVIKLLWRIGLSFVALFLPTFLIGGILPVLVVRKSVPVVGLIGSEQRLVINFADLEHIYADNIHTMDLQNTALDDPYMFLSHYICTVRPEDFSKEVPVNTDARPILEYLNSLDTDTYLERGRKNAVALLEKKESVAQYVEFDHESQLDVLEDYDRQIEEFVRNVMELN